MAVIKKKQDSTSNELLQTILLTLAMTGGGLLALYLALELHFIPSKRADAEAAMTTYEGLKKTLLSDEMATLRKEVKAKEESGETEKLVQDVIEEMVIAHGLAKNRMPGLTRERDGSVKQSITLEPAPMMQIFLFIASVQEAKKSVEVPKITLNQPMRGGEEGSFSATIDFVDYDPPERR